MRRRVATVIVGALLVGFAAGLVQPVTGAARAATDEDYRLMRLFTEVLAEVQQKYVEKKTTKELIIQAIKGMVSSLDPHSAYLTPEEYKELQIETKGSFSGVGIEITMRDGVLTVVAPIEGTPAYNAGIQAGDKIIKIDGKLTKGMSLMEAVKAIRGPKGTKVTLTIMREGLKQLKDFTIVRDIIPIHSVRYYLLDDGYGYVRITNFQENTSSDLAKAIEVLTSQPTPLKGLVLDLRNDPGGLLSEAVRVADQFLSHGVIVSTRGRLPTQQMVFKATPDTTVPDCPVIVLVNQGSASASEIVAAALQDNKRALVVGMPTFGKGSVQSIIPLGANGALRLTTARYYTPNGRQIQAKGITPDIIVPFRPPPKTKPKASESAVVREKDLKGAIPPAPEAKNKPKKHNNSKLYYPKDKLSRDNQLTRALELLKAWEVFAPLARASAQAGAK